MYDLEERLVTFSSRSHGPPWECRPVWVPTGDRGNQKSLTSEF